MKGLGPFGGALGAALVLASLIALGCSSDGGNQVGTNLSRVLGRALAPESDQPVPLANETVVLLTYDDEGKIVNAEVGTTDENGEFQVDVEAQAVIALVVNGTTEDGDAEISGLYNPEPGGTLEKVLDPATSIACVAGLSAIGEGSITQGQLDEDRVANLEDAAEGYIQANPDFDFYSESDRMTAVEAVRTATDDGANPAS